MTDLQRYEMTDDEFADIVAASQPTAAVSFGGVEMPTARQNANMAWRALGDKLGFDWATVTPPAPDDPQTVFYARPVS